MNTPVKISSLTEYISQIDKITRPEISYIYRGQENEAWRVTSSAYRRLEKQVNVERTPELLEERTSVVSSSLSGFLPDLFVGYLKQIVDEVQLKYPTTYRDLSALECMAHLQHNRVATGLIDFTFNPLVALWFACDSREEQMARLLW